MKPLVGKPYQNIEWHMHNLQKLRKIAADKRADILYGSVGVDYGTPKGHSKHADSTAILGMKLAEGCDVGKWVDAIEKTFDYFKGEPEYQIIALHYINHTPIKAIADMPKIGKSKAYRWRDNIVNRCAIQAAAYGLIILENGLFVT